MKKQRVALLGFGRTGRNLFRALYRSSEVEVVAVVDAAAAEPLEYLLKFDTLLGRFPDEVGVAGEYLFVAGQRIRFMTDTREPELSLLSDLGVDLLVEARSRQPHSRESLEADLDSTGARRTVLCVRPEEAPDRTVLMGVNEGTVTDSDRILSNGSGTAHCAAPLLRILDRAFGVEQAFISSVHAYTDQQRLADVPAAEPRSGRAAAENIIPQQTNAVSVLLEVLPEFEGRLSATALNVPVHNGSLIDVVCWHREPVDPTSINEVMRTAAATAEYRDTLAYEDEPIVSRDILATRHSSVFDAGATMCTGERVSKTISWFDNGWAYALRAAELVQYLGTRQAGGGP